MPKQFGFAARGLAVVVLATGLVGCRTASTQLASVPGFGWMDRGEEGWANYEPAPPKPSATSEPTSGGTTSSIASKSDPFSKPIASAAKTDVDSRFDTDKYLPKSKSTAVASTPETKKTFGDYASAYGKYGPPKSLDDKAKALAQTGPYDAGSLASSDSATPKFGGGKPYVRPSSPAPSAETTAAAEQPKAAPYGYVANNRFDTKPATEAATKPESPATYQPTYTADTNSRFGADAYKTASAASSSSSYTPPGFPTTPKAEPLANRFGAGFNNATKAATDQAGRFTNNATGQLNNAASGALSQGQQAFNKFGNAGSNAANSALANAKNAAGSIAGGVTNAGANAFNNVKGQVAGGLQSTANSATNKFNNAVKSQPQQFGNSFANATAGGQSSLASTAQNAVNTAASTAQSQIGNVAAGTNNAIGGASNAVAGVQNYASGYKQAAADAVKNVQNRFGNTAAQTPSFGGNPLGNATAAVQNTAQNLKQNVTNQVQGYAQGAASNVQQNLGSAYQQAKSSATGIVNQTLGNTTQNLSNPANSGVGQARNAIQGYASAGRDTMNNVMQNVSSAVQTPPIKTTYPSTSTPNPFLKPPKMPTTSAPLSPITPQPSAPALNPGNFNPAPSIQRNAAPFLPGSTSNLQGSTTVRKQMVELASASESVREPLQLAVGDQYQFPRSLR